MGNPAATLTFLGANRQVTGSPPKMIFPTHGEIEAADSLAARIRQRLGWEATVPEYGDAVELQ